MKPFYISGQGQTFKQASMLRQSSIILVGMRVAAVHRFSFQIRTKPGNVTGPAHLGAENKLICKISRGSAELKACMAHDSGVSL